MSYKRWSFVAIFLFGIGLALGSAPLFSIADVMSEDLMALEELANRLATLPQFVVFAIIFIKNASVLMLSFVLSPILCLVPILSLVLNGAVLGFVAVTVAEQESVGFVLAGLLPHGIFEIPALIIGQTAALSFGAMTIILVLKKESRTVLVSTVTKDVGRILLALALFFIIGIFHTIIIVALLEKQTRDILMPSLKHNLKYLVIALALLLPAAIIETYITPLLIT